MKSFLPICFCALMLAGTSLFAQQQQPPPNNQNQQTQTITGCLTKSASSGEYVLSEPTTGEKFTFNGPPRLDSYVNHTVQMTGTMMDQNGGKQFRPQSIKSVSDTCQGQ